MTNTDELDTYSMTDQPTTCPQCGARTEWVDTPTGEQLHTCRCGYRFVVEEDGDDIQTIARLEGTITFADGSSHQFQIVGGYGEGAWSQWGATPTELVDRGAGVALDAMADAVAPFLTQPERG